MSDHNVNKDASADLLMFNILSTIYPNRRAKSKFNINLTKRALFI